MFKQFFAMMAQAFLMLTNLFTAGTKLSNAAVHSASYVEGAAAHFNERTSLERLEELDTLRNKYDIATRVRAAENAVSAASLERRLAALQAEAAAIEATTASA